MYKKHGPTSTVGIGFKNTNEKTGESRFNVLITKEAFDALPVNDKGQVSLTIFAARPYEHQGKTITPKYDLRIVETKKAPPAEVQAAAKTTVKRANSGLEI